MLVLTITPKLVFINFTIMKKKGEPEKTNLAKFKKPVVKHKAKVKPRPLTPLSGEESINEEFENMNLRAELKELIAIDKGKTLTNFKEKIKSGELDNEVNEKLGKVGKQMRRMEKKSDNACILKKREAIDHLVKKGVV